MANALDYFGNPSSTAVKRFITLAANINCVSAMEQHALKNVKSGWNTKTAFYLDTSGGENSILYLNVVHFFNTSVNYTSVAD